jgi:hypothetical protein
VATLWRLWPEADRPRSYLSFATEAHRATSAFELLAYSGRPGSELIDSRPHAAYLANRARKPSHDG